MIRSVQQIDKDLPWRRLWSKTFRVFVSQRPRWTKKKLTDRNLDRDWFELRRRKSRLLEWYTVEEAEVCVNYLLWKTSKEVEQAIKYF
jgi:hypothetical protein